MKKPLPTYRKLSQRLLSAALFLPLFLPLFAATYYGAFLLRFAGELTPSAKETFWVSIPSVLAVKWITFTWFRMHRSWNRYITFHDLMVLGQAVTFSAVAVTILDAFLLPQITIPRSILLLDWGTTLMAVGAARALPRLLHDDGWKLFTSPGGVPSLIVGANDSGEALLRAIRRNASLDYSVVGFIDQQPQAQGGRIGGIPVVGTCDDIPRLAKRHGVQEVLITSGNLPGKQVRQLVHASHEHGFHVNVLPSYEQLLQEQVAVHPRPVAIEDLLCRDSVDLDLETIRHWLTGRTILVTGSAGSIGSEICRQLLRLEPARLILVDRSETGQFFLERELRRQAPEANIDVRLADMTDRNRLETLFGDTKPEIIFHAAAYKHVPLMEAHCGEAVKNIVLATRNLVDLADQYEARAFVMISTDKAVNPTSVMGSCKRLAEQYVQAKSESSACRMVTVRFGNVLDSAGSVVPIFREQIASGGPITITDSNIIRYFMMIPEAAQLVIQAGAMGEGGEIFVLDMGEPIRILDLAQDMIRLSGLRVDEDIEIQVVGLRPGEKLYEELYGEGENHERTAHSKIMVAASARRNLLEVIHEIGRLSDLVNGPNEIVKATLQEIIPPYKTPASQRAAA